MCARHGVATRSRKRTCTRSWSCSRRTSQRWKKEIQDEIEEGFVMLKHGRSVYRLFMAEFQYSTADALEQVELSSALDLGAKTMSEY
jgi:hypothetical protein